MFKVQCPYCRGYKLQTVGRTGKWIGHPCSGHYSGGSSTKACSICDGTGKVSRKILKDFNATVHPKRRSFVQDRHYRPSEFEKNNKPHIGWSFLFVFIIWLIISLAER